LWPHAGGGGQAPLDAGPGGRLPRAARSHPRGPAMCSVASTATSLAAVSWGASLAHSSVDSPRALDGAGSSQASQSAELPTTGDEFTARSMPREAARGLGARAPGRAPSAGRWGPRLPTEAPKSAALGLPSMDEHHLVERIKALQQEIQWVETERDGALGQAAAAREEAARLARRKEELARGLAEQGSSWHAEAKRKHEDLEHARLVSAYSVKFQQLQDELMAAAEERDELETRLATLHARVLATREKRDHLEQERMAEKAALAAALAAAPEPPPPPMEPSAPSSPLPRTRRALARFPSAPVLPAADEPGAPQRSSSSSARARCSSSSRRPSPTRPQSPAKADATEAPRCAAEGDARGASAARAKSADARWRPRPVLSCSASQHSLAAPPHSTPVSNWAHLPAPRRQAAEAFEEQHLGETRAEAPARAVARFSVATVTPGSAVAGDAAAVEHGSRWAPSRSVSAARATGSHTPLPCGASLPGAATPVPPGRTAPSSYVPGPAPARSHVPFHHGVRPQARLSVAPAAAQAAVNAVPVSMVTAAARPLRVFQAQPKPQICMGGKLHCTSSREIPTANMNKAAAQGFPMIRLP